MVNQSIEMKDGLFRRPVFHLVIAEDADQWFGRLNDFFEGILQEWGMANTGQFEYQIHRCRSVEEFQKFTGKLLSDLSPHEFVYATLDVRMPLTADDDQPVTEAGGKLVKWCLDRQSQAFEFCVISGEREALSKLYAGGVGRDLQKKSIKRVYKGELDSGYANQELQLPAIKPDLKQFVRRHLKFCTFPIGDRKEMIWFGDNEELGRLRDLADSIASDASHAPYLIFADAAGYEEDWFRLCCHLRGHAPPKLLNFSKEDEESNWEEVLHEPPSALMICRIDKAFDNNCNVNEVLEESDFFSRVENDEALVFFQFPYFDSPLTIKERLDVENEIPTLNACIRHIYGQEKPLAGEKFAFADNEQVIRFPKYDVLQEAGVLHATMLFQSQICQASTGLHGIQIEPEVQEVIDNIPWGEVDGLRKLRTSISAAYAVYEKEESTDSEIPSVAFRRGNDPVRKHFNDELGFRIRGRRLYRILEKDGHETCSVATESADGNRALEQLNSILEVFVRLERLDKLDAKLKIKEKNAAESEFSEYQFSALRAAHSFLRSLFDSPSHLTQQIQRFAPYAGSTSWKQYYPSLREKDQWKAIVENIPFQWPFHQLPLQSGIFDFLTLNGVSYSIRTDVHGIIDRYPSLKQEWSNLDAKRKEIMNEVEKRESQRWAARRFLRESNSQPAMVHLTSSDNLTNADAPRFTTVMQSLVFFNTILAACENRYRFNGSVLDEKSVQNGLARPEIGPNINLLCSYISKVEKSKKVKAIDGGNAAGKLSSSVFRRWTSDWHVEKQSDVARLMREFATCLSKDKKLWSAISGKKEASSEDVFLRMRELDENSEIPPSLVLECLRIIRNTFDKPEPIRRFWKNHYGVVSDIICRFLSATTPDIRIGLISPNGEKLKVWTRSGLQDGNLNDLSIDLAGRLCVLYENREDMKPLFPVDDLMRLHTQDHSLFAQYGGGQWINLTYNPGEQNSMHTTEDELLPNASLETQSEPIFS